MLRILKPRMSSTSHPTYVLDRYCQWSLHLRNAGLHSSISIFTDSSSDHMNCIGQYCSPQDQHPARSLSKGFNLPLGSPHEYVSCLPLFSIAICKSTQPHFLCLRLYSCTTNLTLLVMHISFALESTAHDNLYIISDCRHHAKSIEI